MQRRVRRALLVPLAVLAGCSLAGPDGGACINSCYCHSSGSTAPPEQSPFLRPTLPSRGPRTLLGAAGLPLERCQLCILESAKYYSETCPGKQLDVLVKVNEQWNRDDGYIYVDEDHLGVDPCRGNAKTLKIIGMVGTEDGYKFRVSVPDGKKKIDLGEFIDNDGKNISCCRPNR